MKNKILITIAFLASLISFSSCDESWNIEGVNDNTGSISLTNLKIEVSEDETVVTRSESRSVIDLAPYLVTIYNSDNQIEKQWTYNKMPELFSLPVGDYKIEVKSHEIKKAAWNEPYYIGTQAFSIIANKITEIETIVCKFQSLKISVIFDDSLLAQMEDDVRVEVTANKDTENEATLFFTSHNMTDRAYFDLKDGSSTFAIHFTGTVNGYKEDFSKAYSNVNRGEHYIITFKLRNNPLEPDPETGSVDPNDGINVSVEVEEENVGGSIDGSEDPIDDDNIHNPEDFVEQIEGDYDPTSNSLSITAGAGLTSVILNINSDNNDCLNYFSSINNVDLANPGSAVGDLQKYGLPITGVTGATSITLDLSKLSEAFREFEGTHSLIVNATDQEGNTIDPMTIVMEGKEVPKTITFESELHTDGTPMNPLDYNNGQVIIKAPAGIQNLIVVIDSNSDDFAGVSKVISGKDFAHTEEGSELGETLKGFGFAYGEQVLNKTEVVFDITTFIGPAFLPAFPGIHTFILSVTDNDNNTESAIITFEVPEP